VLKKKIFKKRVYGKMADERQATTQTQNMGFEAKKK